MPRRKAVSAAGLVLVTLSLGTATAVFVGGSAAAPPKQAKTATATTPAAPLPVDTTTTESPADGFFVINATVNAASDHEIVGSSAFPNFTTGAVDNYYSMAHSHVDNSPFAEGTASPADTGPIGQTAAAGNAQQPQYADARWPGDSGKATYGNQGGPYASAQADAYRATAEASEASNGLSGPGPTGAKTLVEPAGFKGRLRQALGSWKASWQGRLLPKKAAPTVSTPAGTVTIPKAPVTVPKAGAKPPAATVPTPIATVTTPATPPVAGANPAPPVTVPTPTLPSVGAQGASRGLASRPTPPLRPRAAGSAQPDGESLLASSSETSLVAEAGTSRSSTTATKPPKNGSAKKKPARSYAIVSSGESSLGRVSLGGGQIVIEGIHVTASIANDGTPTYKAAVTVASATIGGVPVTIDQDGVHVAGQGQGLPYQQASDALNGALKQAGIQLFLVAPEVTTGSCDQSGTGSGPATPPSSDQSGAASSCDQTGSTCDQSGSGGGGGTGLPVPAPAPASTDASSTDTTTSSCDETSTTCDQPSPGRGSGTGTDTTSTTTATTTPLSPRSDTTTDTTATSSCAGSGLPSTLGSCARPGPGTGTSTGTTTTASDQSGMTGTTGSGDEMGLGPGTSSSGEETVTATGVHVVFTQPVSPSGVPAQFVEHILGEVYVDSLAVPAGALPDLGLSSSSSSTSSLGASCGGRSRGATSGVSATGGGGLSGGGSASSGSLSSSPSGAAFGSTSQPGSTGTSLPAAFATALRKPLWLLLAYLLWQTLVIGTGWSLWNWRRGDAS